MRGSSRGNPGIPVLESTVRGPPRQQAGTRGHTELLE